MSETKSLYEQAEEFGAKRVWGEHSLNLGELIGFIVGAYLVFKPPSALGEKWGRVLGLVIIFVSQALF